MRNLLISFLLFSLFAMACTSEQKPVANSPSNNTIAVTAPNLPQGAAPGTKESLQFPAKSSLNPPPSDAGTPEDAYKRLYEAVKKKDSNLIASMMSSKSLSFAEGAGGQQGKTIEKMLENGFTETTFAKKLPKMRDQRIKDNFGNIEVYSEKSQKWEDLPFVFESGGWKLAVGDIFAGSFVSPGPSKAAQSAAAANTAVPMKQIPMPNAAGNTGK